MAHPLRYATALRSTLLDFAPRPALVDQDDYDYDALQDDLTESEMRVSTLDDATTDAATALLRIVDKLDAIGVEDRLTDTDRKAFETLTTEIQDIAEELRVV